MSKLKERYVVCVKNGGGADLELRKLYLLIPDADAERDDYVRVVDESGDDYLYPSSYFVPVDLSEESARALRTSSKSRSRPTR